MGNFLKQYFLNSEVQRKSLQSECFSKTPNEFDRQAGLKSHCCRQIHVCVYIYVFVVVVVLGNLTVGLGMAAALI